MGQPKQGQDLNLLEHDTDPGPPEQSQDLGFPKWGYDLEPPNGDRTSDCPDGTYIVGNLKVAIHVDRSCSC